MESKSLFLPNLTGEEHYNLYRRYKSLTMRHETLWEDFYDFAMWAKESGYFKRAFLRRKNPEKPYGPENAYWSHSPEAKERYSEKNTYVPAFCQKCKIRNPEHCEGCKGWRENYIRNWNENIRRDVAEELLSTPKRQCFTYEHPDLVRDKMRTEMSDELSQCNGVDEGCPRRKR